MTSARKALITTRSLRSSGLTLERALRRDKALNSSGDYLDVAEDKIKAGDLGAILARVQDQICLVVIEALNFRQGTSKMNLAMVDVKQLDGEGTKATSVAVQALRLVARNESSIDELTWWWPQDYIQVLDNHGKPILQRHLVLRVSGKRFHPLNPEIIYSSTENPQPIWSLHHRDLEQTLARAWLDLDPDSTDLAKRIQLLPQILGPDSDTVLFRP
jgi:hypothetical protein